MENWTKENLITFEREIERMWTEGRIKSPVHFSGGNEEQLIKIFKKIKPTDYVFSTHRSHYHYLLKGGDPTELVSKILNGESICINEPKIKFYSSGIVCGTPAIAVGVALALKRKKSKNRVWCFLGDGALDEGHFYEAYRYAQSMNLPIMFIIEHNNRSVEASVEQRWGSNKIKTNKHLNVYYYNPTYPHVGNGKWVKFT